ncbi:hypothetical protein J4401_01260 [Candidatus Woesearchaeota archaeon]|nr:hypothetical protein [Candidatus Woesearchaeota archaeon]
MTYQPEPVVKIVAFGDEYSLHAKEHFEFLAKHGLELSARFFSFVDRAKLEHFDNLPTEEYRKKLGELSDSQVVYNVSNAPKKSLQRYADMAKDYGVKANDVGSPLGKQWIGAASVSDIAKVTNGVVRAANALDTRIIRMFSFYPGTRENPMAANRNEQYRDAIALLRYVGRDLKRAGLVGFLENETGLFGNTGYTLRQIIEDITGNPDGLKFFAYHDGANDVRQNKRENAALQSFRELKQFLAGLHIKDAPSDYAIKNGESIETAEWPHSPAGQGDSNYQVILAEFTQIIPRIRRKLKGLGLDGLVPLVLEPHRQHQGKYGGFTGSLYMESIMALRGLLDGINRGVNVHNSEVFNMYQGEGDKIVSTRQSRLKKGIPYRPLLDIPDRPLLTRAV